MATFVATGLNDALLDHNTKEVFIYMNADDEDMRKYLKEEFGESFGAIRRKVTFDLDPEFLAIMNKMTKGGKK